MIYRYRKSDSSKDLMEFINTMNLDNEELDPVTLKLLINQIKNISR